MSTSEFKVNLGGNKLRDDREVQAFATLVEVKDVSVKSLNLIVNSVTSLDAQRAVLGLPVLSQLETLTIRQEFSLGAKCVETLVEVLEAGHIRALVNLDLRYFRHEPPRLAAASGATPLFSTQASSTASRSLPSLRSGGTSARSFTTSFSGSQSLTSTTNDPSQASNDTPISWKGFASLASALRSDWLPQHKAFELNASLSSINLGDEGAAGLAELIETGCMSSMKELNLDNNSIGTEGIEALGRALRRGKLPHLTTLDLSVNSFQETKELITALEENCLPSLEKIVLYGAGRSVAEAIVQVYHRNTALTATIDIDWPARALEAKWNLAQQRNQKLTQLLKTLNAGGGEVPVTNGKVFICGFPGVGKTTLRKSLKRSRWRAFIGNELKLREPMPTRGIEVSHITGQWKGVQGKLTLKLWDLAGQEEFHVLHSSFLPDLGMANGKATTFLVVLDASYNRSSGASAEEELTYWLRFIASNSIVGMKRNVVIVLNTFHGGSRVQTPQWCALVDRVHLLFQEYLEIGRQPIVLDARLLSSVEKLKQKLFQHTGSVLQGLCWPKVCGYIQRNLQSWAKENQNFPVIHWNDFTAKMAASRLAPETLEAAVEYLHETGHLIYFRKGSLVEGESPETKLIVLDPQWFCKRIVGELLLPDDMVREGEGSLKVSVARDGSLGLPEIKSYFTCLLKDSPQVSYVVGMLIRLGLCYKVGPEKVLIPALVEEEQLPDSWGRDDASRQFMGPFPRARPWVMGRSLTLMDTERTALPISLFRRLQVQLAQDSELGGMKNSKYTVRKSSLTFEKSGIVILVQCDVHERDPRDDRIDTIAKPLGGDPVTQRKKQIELVEVVMERLQDLCSEWCRGVTFIEKVILPWSASEGAIPMLDRNTNFTLNEIRSWVQSNGLRGTADSGDSDLNCRVDGEELREDDLLSTNEIYELQKKMAGELDAKADKLKQLVIDLGLGEIPVEEPSSSSRNDGVQSDEPGTITNGMGPRSSSSTLPDTEKTKTPNSRRGANRRPTNVQIKDLIKKENQKTRSYIGKEGKETREHVDQRINEVLERTKEVGENFWRTFEMQRQVLQKVQNLEILSFQQTEIVVPRFMYLVEKSGAWLSLRRALKTKAQLHLLCEARYKDGALHPVEGQRGVEVSKLKEWASDIEPWLNYSMKVAVVAAQVVAGILFPGLNLLFPNFEEKDSKNLSRMLSEELMTPDAQESTVRSGSRRFTAMEVNQRARYILKQLLGEPLENEISEKFGLKRVMLYRDASTHSSSSSSSPTLAWICGPCHRKYGALAKDISPYKSDRLP